MLSELKDQKHRKQRKHVFLRETDPNIGPKSVQMLTKININWRREALGRPRGPKTKLKKIPKGPRENFQVIFQKMVPRIYNPPRPGANITAGFRRPEA